jgi:putative hemolysin
MKLIQDNDLVKVAKLEKLGGKNTARILMSLLQFDKINDIYSRHYQKDTSHFVTDVLIDAGIRYHISDADLKNIPKEGGFILIANHPYGGAEGLILLDAVTKIRPDFKIMANFLYNWIDPLKEHVFCVNPFETRKNAYSSLQGLKKAFAHVATGHALAIFPAGEVSTYLPGSKIVADKQWNSSIIRFIRNTEVPVVPVYFHGSNSWLFHFMGKVHPLLRTVKIPSELLNKQNGTISLAIGSPIEVKEQYGFSDITAYGRYLRARVYCMSNLFDNNNLLDNNTITHMKPVSVPVNTLTLALEIVNITPYYQLFQWQQYSVYCVPSSVIPKITAEIGRLREITFREAGEGTNEITDLDEFDTYYHQLFIWDSHLQKIVGGYRVGKGKDIIKQYGMSGFYTQTLFRMDKEMFPLLNESIELGRSFIVKEYQRKPLSLFLLWKGILHFLWENPEYNYLVGPVSISNSYTSLSQGVMIQYIKKHHFDHAMSWRLKARRPFAYRTSLIDTDILIKNTNSLQALDRLIKAIDPNNDRIPVLLRKYLELGGKIASFNVDPKFSNVVDGFLILELRNVKPEMVQALTGKQVSEEVV